MLCEDRYEIILDYLAKKGSGSIKELSSVVGTSESTIRRDLTTLAENGLLSKVYGGATSINRKIITEEQDMLKKHNLFSEEKERIGKYAASLIKKDDFVFIDAGTTTEAVTRYLTEKDAIYMTNGLFIAQLLLARGFKTYIVGGHIRSITESIVSEEAVNQIHDCNFSIGFFGTNGITIDNGFTTPAASEATFKHKALKQTSKVFILADPSKFGKIYSRTFARINEAKIITTELPDKAYLTETVVKEVDT